MKQPDIQARDIKRLLMRVYRRFQAGAISDQQATKEVLLLSSILKAIETADLEQKLGTLSQLMERD
jgi:hypothetical protein